MVRIAIVALVFVLALPGLTPAQGLLDSIFGSGGLGLWSSGPESGNQFSPQTYGGYQNPGFQGQQPYPGSPQAAPGYPQGYAQPGYGQQAPGYYPQGQGYNPQQQGIYSDWQNYPYGAGGTAPQTQYSQPQQYPAPQQYTGPPAGAQAPAAPRGTAQTPTLRPGQYAPGQLPTTSDDLPPGAVSITTTTPEGTRVEYYPPTGEPMEGAQGAVRPRPRQQRQTTAGGASAPRRVQQPREQSAVGGAPSSGSAPIAMPRPVEIPQGQDPRSGWGAAVNR